MTKTPFQQVAAMNVAFGNPKGDPNNIDWQRLRSQIANIIDEINETQTAIGEGNTTEIRDGLCDIQVFAQGALHFMGANGDSYSPFASFASFPFDNGFGMGPLEACLADISRTYDNANKALEGHLARDVISNMRRIIANTNAALTSLGADPVADMTAVVAGVMTRFCADPDELAATAAKYAAHGIEFYEEGEFPTLCLKSAKDQPDIGGKGMLPKGKFLKSVAYKNTVFAPLPGAATA